MLCALQVKSSYSLLKSLNNISVLVSKASNLGYSSLAITDNNMFGVMEFYIECKKHNIKPIIGLELRVNEINVLLYAKSNVGYKNLIKLSTIISERDIGIDDLIKYKSDLILVMSKDCFSENIFNIYEDSFIGYNNVDQIVHDKYKYVYINDVLYVNKEDYKYLDYLYMIDEDKRLGNYELNTHKGKHLLDLSEFNMMVDEFVLDNFKYIIDNCNVEIGYTKDLLPVYDSNIDAYTYLCELCYKGLNRRLNNSVSLDYKKRLDYELGIIKQMGFCDYFLIVWDYVKYAKFNDILVGPGRGSAAGSLVSYTLGITDIDPIKYDLLFERFLNPERVSMPDIDIDFDSEKRSNVIDYVTRKYGEKRVAGIITFNTMGAKQVLRDVGRVMNFSIGSIDGLTKMIKNESLSEVFSNNSKFRTIINGSVEFRKLYDVALKLEGIPRHISVHAAGIVMSRIDLDETIPLFRNQLGMFVTGYSMNYLEGLGLLKMDFLGISNLTLIDKVIKEIRCKEELNITFSNIPLNDKKTYDIFRNGNTDGIFQFESNGMKKFLKKLKPNCFDDIIAALALYRPGPMANIDTYIRRKEGKEKVEYLVPCLENVLKATYGIIIYQEQIMQIARVMAGFSLGDADNLRRAMSKKKEELLIKEKPKFIEGCIRNGYDKEISEKVYNLILKFANYGFNKSHSVGYATVAYKMAFLKKYFFKYFMSYLLSNSIGSEVKTKNYINECRSNNIKVVCPDINVSSYKYEIIGNEIICPLSIIRGVGTVGCSDIIKLRDKGKFTNFIDFIKRASTVNISKKLIEGLIYAGCFNSFGYNKRTLIENIDNLITYAELSMEEGIVKIEVPEIIEYDEFSRDELIEIEYKVFGFYLMDHPVSKYRKDYDVVSIEVINHYDKFIRLVLQISKIKEVVTKNNDVMAFVSAGDEYDYVDLTLFPNIYENYSSIRIGNIVMVEGRVEKRFDKYQIIVNKLEILE